MLINFRVQQALCPITQLRYSCCFFPKVEEKLFMFLLSLVPCCESDLLASSPILTAMATATCLHQGGELNTKLDTKIWNLFFNANVEAKLMKAQGLHFNKEMV